MTNRFLLSSALLTIAASSSAYAGNDSTFGTTFSFNRLAGQSYSGISLTATDANNGSGGFGSYTSAVALTDASGDDYTYNIHLEAADFGPAGADGFGSTLSILAGIASADTTVNIRVRKPNDNEVFGFSTTPPLNDSAGWSSVLSDIFDVSGIASTGPAVNGVTPTDAFVLQLTYEDGSYIEDYVYEWGNTASWTEADIVSASDIQLAFFNPSTGVYADDDLGNFTPGSTVVQNFSGAYADFVTAQGNYAESDLSNYVGSWGVDQTNNHVWAVFDHNTVFASVPEPKSIAIILLAAPLLSRRRRA